MTQDFAARAPHPHELFAQAEREHPTDRRAQGARYRELLREYGMLVIVPIKTGQSRNLPCGWPGRRRVVPPKVRP